MAKNRTGFLGLVDMAGVLLDELDPGDPGASAPSTTQDRGQLSAPATARARTRTPRALAPVSAPSGPGRDDHGSATPPHVIEAIDSETGVTTWVVVHGSARAECSSPEMAEQIRSALVGR